MRTYGPRTSYRPQNTERPAPVPPKDNPYLSIPSGRYALRNVREDRWYFFRVSNPDKGKWVGFTFLVQYSGDNEERIRPGAKYDAILRHIMENPLGSAQDYGKHSGHCGICGIQLTDPVSLARGIGPICAQKY
jgi:hypothetical protein